VDIQMGGDGRNGNPQFPSPTKKNLLPAIQPRLHNELAEETFLNKVPGNKDRIEHSILRQAKPNAAV